MTQLKLTLLHKLFKILLVYIAGRMQESCNRLYNIPVIRCYLFRQIIAGSSVAGSQMVLSSL
jgi:hypothetical protein